MVWPLLDQTLIDHAPRDGGHFEVNRTFPARPLLVKGYAGTDRTLFRNFRGCKGKFCLSSVVFTVYMSHTCTPK